MNTNNLNMLGQLILKDKNKDKENFTFLQVGIMSVGFIKILCMETESYISHLERLHIKVNLIMVDFMVQENCITKIQNLYHLLISEISISLR